ncbi:MAG: prolyl oligopeptidase family serine peptidase [bacterium]
MNDKFRRLVLRWTASPVLLLALILSPISVPAQNAANHGSFSLEQILSAPFPTGLIAAPQGAKIAWVQNARGVRNLWIAEGPDYRGRQITGYREDDGQELGSLQFTPDEQSIIYVRGGEANRQGEIPNPLSHPDGANQAIWIVPIAGDTSRQLAEGDSPAVSPQGDLVVFIRKGQVWSMALAPEAKPEQLFKIRGSAGSLRWSPDGSMLAFVSNRGDHSFIGIYTRSEKKLRYLDPSVDRDSSPVWSPDGRQIAFLRVPNQRQRLPFLPMRSALPWAIRVADVNTGKGRALWSAEPGAGSAFRSISADDQIFWGDGDRIVFPWEKDGWTHLYAVDLNGGKPELLTPGAFEVQYVSITPDRREIIYSSNQDDIDRQHLWRVAIAGGKAKPVTTGEGIEWSPVMTASDKAIALLASGAREPAHAAIITGSKPRPLAAESIPADFPSQHLVKPQQVIFSAADGMRIHGQLFLPSDLKAGERRPAVLFFHGGSRRQMLLGFHDRGYYHNAYALNQYLASRGYIVLSVNYRSGIGYGMEFREALNYGANGASEFNDVLGAGLYLRSRSDVDPARLGLWGGSYGGYLTALGLARASDLFAAGVDLHGVHDWNVVIRNFVPTYDAGDRAEVARLAFESSPMAAIKDWRSPILLIHGDDDRNVPFSESVDLAESLRQQGVEVEQLIFPDELHGFLLHANWLTAYHATADFFDRKLKKQPAVK